MLPYLSTVPTRVVEFTVIVSPAPDTKSVRHNDASRSIGYKHNTGKCCNVRVFEYLPRLAWFEGLREHWSDWECQKGLTVRVKEGEGDRYISLNCSLGEFSPLTELQHVVRFAPGLRLELVDLALRDDNHE